MKDSRKERERLELDLREKLRAAEKGFHKARIEHAEIRAKYRDMLDTVDGTYAIHQAAKQEFITLQIYKTALKHFSDLVLYGKLPPTE